MTVFLIWREGSVCNEAIAPIRLLIDTHILITNTGVRTGAEQVRTLAVLCKYKDLSSDL